MRKHGKKIADFQYQQKRLADVAIDLFVGLCTLSRADSLVRKDPAKGATAVAIAEIFTRQARRRMARNVRGLERNEDPQMDKLAGYMLDKGAYEWDVI